MKKISILNSGIFVFTSNDDANELEVYIADTPYYLPYDDSVFGRKVDIVDDDDYNEVMTHLQNLKSRVETNKKFFNLYNLINGCVKHLGDSKVMFSPEDITTIMNEIEEYHYKKIYESINTPKCECDTCCYDGDVADDDTDLASDELNKELAKLAEDYLYVRYNEMDSIKEKLPKEYEMTKELLVDFGKYIYNL